MKMKRWWDDSFMDLDNRIGKVFNRMLKVYLIIIFFMSVSSGSIFMRVINTPMNREHLITAIGFMFLSWSFVMVLSVTLLVKHEEKEFWLKQIRDLVGDILEIIEGGTSGKSNS